MFSGGFKHSKSMQCSKKAQANTLSRSFLGPFGHSTRLHLFGAKLWATDVHRLKGRESTPHADSANRHNIWYGDESGDSSITL